ncbi:hypothetical protein [Nocardioides litoris]|uniref:hypothetical protein n=1 Tax=Nocardioides litoris TaxID=1926648 RepID=UPI001120A5B6|nr:hypothetical protein [Nocardioides litoris]
MSDASDLRWSTHADPDFLVLQPAPVPAVSDGRPVDVLRELFARRGFRPVAEAERLDLGASSGCLLSRGDDGEVALLVTISERAGATRFALPGLDPEWWARAVQVGHAAVLVSSAALGLEGPVDRDQLRADVEAGGVVAALVPAAG